MFCIEKYSFSKIKRFYSCPYSYYLHYYEKPEKENPNVITGSGISEFGTFAHSILEKYTKGELDLCDILNYYEENYDNNIISSSVLDLGNGFIKDLYSLYYNDGYKYFSNFNGFDKLEILETEYEFEENIDNKFIFTGKIDLIAKDSEDRLVVIDHKSKSEFKSKKEKEEYAVQLYLYAYAIFKKYGKFPHRLMFNMFRKQKWVTIDFDKKKYIDAIAWLKDSVDEIESCLEFNTIKHTFYCRNFCDYRNAYFDECHK